MEPKEHHLKLTKNENMTIALAKVMVRSTMCGAIFPQKSLTPLSTKLQQLLVDFNFTSLLLISSRATKRSEAFFDFNFTFLFIHVGT